MLMWHKKGEQRMIETRIYRDRDRDREQTENTDTGTSEDHKKRNTDTHTDTNKRPRERDMNHMIQGELVLRGGDGLLPGLRLSAPVPDDECGDTIVRAIRHEARSSGLGDGSSYLYQET